VLPADRGACGRMGKDGLPEDRGVDGKMGSSWGVGGGGRPRSSRASRRADDGQAQRDAA